jgi:hypothetical protein
MKTGLLCSAALLGLANTGCDAPSSRSPSPPASVAADVLPAPKPSAAIALTAKLPDGWYAMTTDQQSAVMQRGADLAIDKPELKAVTKAALNNTGQPFAYFKYAPGAPADDNAYVMAMTEEVGHLPGLKTGKDYFFQVQRTFAQTTIKPQVVGDYSTRIIDGQSFDRMDLILNMGVAVKETMYAARHGDYVYAFIQAYQSDADRATTDKILDSVKLHW